jgi:hypothetical protein
MQKPSQQYSKGPLILGTEKSQIPNAMLNVGKMQIYARLGCPRLAVRRHGEPYAP